VRKIHSENLVTVLNRREVDGHVCLRAAVRLHVRVIGAKQLLRAIDRGLFDNVGPLATTVVALARITLGVLVREHRPGSLQHRFADEIFRRDQFETIRLACDFVIDRARDHRINLRQRRISRVIH
jgi:hypothetical protein